MIAHSISVVVPTYGAGLYLNEVLHGLARQTTRDFDVVVVDNNVPRRWEGPIQLGRDLYAVVVHEPRNGLQFARNTGVACTQGEVVAFLDDDAIPARTWLDCLLRGLNRHGSAAVGGTVSLDFAIEPPSWLGVAERAMLSELSYAGEDVPCLREDMYIVGANMCIRRSSFDTYGEFDTRFDRTADTLRSSGELEFQRRLQEAGERVSFIAAARVRHQIPAARLSERYFAKRAYWQGRSDALLHAAWGRPLMFGRRTACSNLRTVVTRFVELLSANSQDHRVARRLTLLREYGYCLQSLIQGVTPTRLVAAMASARRRLA